MGAIDVASIASKEARHWSLVREAKAEPDAITERVEQFAPAPLCVSSLAKEYHGAFMRFLRRRVPSGAVGPEDIAQEAYIRMLQYEGSDAIRSPYFLLLRVAMNVMKDQHRADQVRRIDRHRSLGSMDIASDAPDPERAAVHAEELDCVLDAINDLTPRCREVFLLHRFSHSAYPEIARDFGISVKMVEKYISTALARCADRVAS